MFQTTSIPNDDLSILTLTLTLKWRRFLFAFCSFALLSNQSIFRPIKDIRLDASICQNHHDSSNTCR